MQRHRYSYIRDKLVTQADRKISEREKHQIRSGNTGQVLASAVQGGVNPTLTLINMSKRHLVFLLHIKERCSLLRYCALGMSACMLALLVLSLGNEAISGTFIPPVQLYMGDQFRLGH